MPSGGKRPGAGRRLGSKNKTTLDKEAARDVVRALVTAELGPLVQAQIANAKGLAHVFLRDPKTGQWSRVTDERAIEAALNAGQEHYWIFTKDPSIQAFTDLMNRVLDKPKEQALDMNVNTDAELLARLDEGRKRNAERRPGEP